MCVCVCVCVCRSALDVMRLVELLVVLIVEGRKALPKTPHSSTITKRMESVSGDKSHRQVIEAIRGGNNEEFYECMVSGKAGQDMGRTCVYVCVHMCTCYEVGISWNKGVVFF